MKDNFLEISYVSKLIKEGYIEVDRINLPDGEYRKAGGGYQIDVLVEKDVDNNFIRLTGYSIVTNDGIRGSWNPVRDKVTIKDGLPLGENVYKILSNVVSDKREDKLNKLGV